VFLQQNKLAFAFISFPPTWSPLARQMWRETRKKIHATESAYGAKKYTTIKPDYSREKKVM
jgi:hypothetical protein